MLREPPAGTPRLAISLCCLLFSASLTAIQCSHVCPFVTDVTDVVCSQAFRVLSMPTEAMLSGVILKDLFKKLMSQRWLEPPPALLERPWARQSALCVCPPTELAAAPSAPMVWVVFEPVGHPCSPSNLVCKSIYCAFFIFV